jgi:hypothetical protein
MDIRDGNCRAWLWVPLLSLLASTTALAVSDSDVNELQKQCEALRTEAMAPIRAQKTQTCIEQQLRSKGHCERYYTTYGNVSPGPSGAAQSGYFYDLPECQAWLEARDALRAGRSRP